VAVLTARLLVLLALTLLLPLGARASLILSQNSAKEYEVKAAFLFNFLRFVDWPNDASGGDYVIGVVGRDPFGSALEKTVQGKKVNGRGVVVKRLAWTGDLKKVHILFVPEGETSRGADELRSLRGSPVLVVGESPDFARSQGVVNFYLAGNTIRFEINPDAAKKSRLTISSQLLQLAKITGGS
jgi:hypothetical protein